MVNTLTWKDNYRSKLGDFDAVAKLLRTGDNVLSGFISNMPPTEFYDAVTRRIDANELDQVNYYDGLRARPGPLLDPEYLEKYDDHVTYYNCYGMTGPSKKIFRSNTCDFFPCNSADYPDRMARICDVFITGVTPPNDKGYCNIGPVNFFTLDVIKQGRRSGKLRTLIGVMNSNLPTVYGDNWIHVSEFDAVVEHDTPLVCPPRGQADEVEQAIAKHALSLIPDGATIQMGMGGISEAVAAGLTGRKDLGVMSEVIPDVIEDMHESGLVTNKLKPHYTGKSVASICVGDQRFYDYLDHNPDIYLGPSSLTTDIGFVKAHPNMVALNSILAIDLSSQIASEGIGHTMISGCGGQLEFAIGAHFAEGGLPIFVTRASRMVNGELVSNIVPDLEPGTPVTVPRTYADHVVTEYGVANLRYKSRRERALELISIAHPDFRGELKAALRKSFYPSYRTPDDDLK